MKNDQVIAARKALNPHRATIKLDVSANQDGSETLVPYRVDDADLRGQAVTVSRETLPTDVIARLSDSIRSIPQD